MSIVKQTEHMVTFSVGDLQVTIGDNESDPPGVEWRYKQPFPNEEAIVHMPGYNGLWSLSSVHRPQNLFMPRVAGLNYEFIFDGELQDDLRRFSFHPRSCPIEFAVVDDRTVRMHQPPTAYRGVESWWEFQVHAPYYIDLSFQSSPTKPFPYGWFAVFWANYITSPTDPWMRFVTPDGKLTERPRQSGPHTIVPTGSRELVTRPDWKEGWLRRDDFTFTEPYFVGIQEHMMYQVMVHTDGLLGFASPRPLRWPPENQPWDFHVTFFDVQPGERYGFKARVVYAPWEGEEQPRQEHQKWLRGA